MFVYKLQVFMDWNPIAMTARGGDIRTDYIGRQCPDALGMWRAAVDEGVCEGVCGGLF